MSSVLLLDNYDSFTFNVYHLIREVTDVAVVIKKNDEIDLDDVKTYNGIIISPGPDLPDNAGISKQIIEKYSPYIPILGICLGHQAIAEVFGGRLRQLDQVYHGYASDIRLADNPGQLFWGLPSRFKVGRYHSWVVDENYLPDNLRVTSKDEDGYIMSVEHVSLPVYGVQFHPESYMTEAGPALMANFLHCVR